MITKEIAIYLKLKKSRDILLLDINECSTGADACDVNAKCKNTVGSYTCTCKIGFTGNGRTCTGKIYLTDWFLPFFQMFFCSREIHDIKCYSQIVKAGSYITLTGLKCYNTVFNCFRML